MRRATISIALLIPPTKFLSTLSLRRATTQDRQSFYQCQFLSTLSLRRATVRKRQAIPIIQISIHALLAESDETTTGIHGFNPLFLSTLSLRRATVTVLGIQHRVGISIHALLAESDESRQPSGRPTKDFYPRSPCGERHDYAQYCIRAQGISIHALLAESDGKSNKLAGMKLVFLSTLSLRRATRLCTILYSCPGNFYPRSPCGERRGKVTGGYDRSDFYPRSPCGERLNGICLMVHICGFLSTLSLRRATIRHRIRRQSPVHFYPRSPCGERPCIMTTIICIASFLSTLSLRRATAGTHAQWPTQQISIHALLAESDVLALCSFGGASDFYPRSPCGERPANQTNLPGRN